MIEKKTMGYADFAYPGYEAKVVTVIVDSETGKVELYRPEENESEWYTPNKNEHFYPTIEDATDALKKHQQEMFDKMGKVKDYIEVMNNWKDNMTDDDPLHFNEEDYLPSRNFSRRIKASYWESRFNEVSNINDYLLDIVRTGFINIKGDSFKVKDIKHIKWGEKKAEIILTDDRKIETGNNTEFDIVKFLVGKNNSHYTYTRLNDKD
jgi:hypothetical protein